MIDILFVLFKVFIGLFLLVQVGLIFVFVFWLIRDTLGL